MNKELTPLEAWKLIDKSGTMETLCIIETALKNYEELTSKPVILYGRTHGYSQALIDTICKNYKEVKITNLDDENKLKALEIIKTKKGLNLDYLKNCENVEQYNKTHFIEKTLMERYAPLYHLNQAEFDLLKEVLL